MGKGKGWDYLGFGHRDSDDPTGSIIDDDGGYGFRNSDGSGYYHGADGSYESWDSDGSGFYHGADGSYGSKNSDGSGFYHGADGSYGSKSSDGSGFYHGADGSYGSLYSDGSGYYHGSDGSYESIDPDDSRYNIDSYDTENNDEITGVDALGGLIGAGIGLYAVHKANKEQRIRDEKERQEIRRIERHNFYREHWKGILVLSLVGIVLLFGYLKYTDYKNRIEVGISSDELIGLKYEEAQSKLSERGFTNIQKEAIKDLTINDIDKEDIITQVSIRGKADIKRISFDKNDKFPYDAYIKLIYHELEEIKVPMSSKELKKFDYKVVSQQFENAGFINVKFVKEHDLVTGWINKDGSIESISVDGDTSFEDYSRYRPDVEIIIKYHTFK